MAARRAGLRIGVARSVYILADAADGNPAVVLATGSKGALCMTGFQQLNADGIKPHVLSMLSWKLFESPPQRNRDSILPLAVAACPFPE